MASTKVHEEDVDDLDDIVDEFDEGTSNPIVPPALPKEMALNMHAAVEPQAGPSQASKQMTQTGTNHEQMPEELAKELADGMERLMRELSGGTDSASAKESEEEARKRAEAWENMLVDGLNGVSLDPDQRPKANSGSGSGQASMEDAFQASILQAMEKLRDSDSTLHSDAASAATSANDPLEAILNQLTAGMDGTGDENEELQNMLETMMQQLMSKDVLYEPLKELNDKFPTYLRENESKLSAEDRERYSNQMTRVSQIVAIFEKPGYKENDQETGAKIVTLMNEMQSYGSPPTEIMGELPPGLDFSGDGTPKIPDNCLIA